MTRHAARWIVVVMLVAGPVEGCSVPRRPVAGPIPKICASDPDSNRKQIQTLIANARPGDTVVLPPGRCVVARCGVAQGTRCLGVDNVAHDSALYIGGKSQLTIVGAPDGSSILTLDPKPPLVGGLPTYCGQAHLLTVHRSRAVTLRGFTLDGSDPLLQGDGQCPKTNTNPDGLLNEHMHDIFVHTSTDVLIEQMKVTRAHGDGINLAGDLPPPAAPGPTERVVIRSVDVFENHRAGISFQRNAGQVRVAHNTVRNTLHGTEIHMEPSGDASTFGPYQVAITDNTIERNTIPGLAVTLGGDAGVIGRGISFVHNVVRNGCLQVHDGDQVTITDNTVGGASNCATIAVNTSHDVTIARNTLNGLANLAAANGTLVPVAVIDVRERQEKQSDCSQAGATCHILIAYTDHVTLDANAIVQHLPESPGIVLSNVDVVSITGNSLRAAADQPPLGRLRGLPAVALQIGLGVRDAPAGTVYLNELRRFTAQTIRSNRLASFDDGLLLATEKPTVTLDTAVVDENRFDVSVAKKPHGIVIGAATPFVGALDVAANQFGCGFEGTGTLPPFAFVAPPGQGHSGNVGTVAPCGLP